MRYKLTVDRSGSRLRTLLGINQLRYYLYSSAAIGDTELHAHHAVFMFTFFVDVVHDMEA